MLRRLRIDNIALIDHLEITLNPGLTIITGETGAGKSILIDALGLTLGERADASLLRTGSEQGRVTACFQLPPLPHPARQWLIDQELDLPGDDLFLRRTLGTGGRSRAYINDHPVSVAALAALAALLVDLHGQHDHQSLLRTETHLELLDAFGGHGTLVTATASLHKAWQSIREQLAEIERRAREAGDRRQFLEFQLEELESAGVSVGELAELTNRRTRLAHATRLQQASRNALDLLTEAPTAASDLISRAATELENRVDLDPTLADMAATIRSIQYDLDAAAETIRHYQNGLEADPEQLELLDERVNLIRDLSRKHRREADQLPELVKAWRNELSAMNSMESDEQTLTRQLAKALQEYKDKATALSQHRRQAAERLTREVENQLKDLYMARTRVAISLRPLGGNPRPKGCEEAEFEVSANTGEPLKPLKLVASGGELSRIMLALKTVLADAVTVQTLIFDEVDVGVGGRVASRIGSKLAEVARGGRQLLAITHLPQVAAWGENHLRVEKSALADRTRVQIQPLDETERVEELARMLAGDAITAPARHNARELLRSARSPSTQEQQHSAPSPSTQRQQHDEG
ncbi:MAG: DNA repair protein RecN [Magnetococcales bacterium]|nr:DNA repair protein RecN [Magnetococcales bacterium]